MDNSKLSSNPKKQISLPLILYNILLYILPVLILMIGVKSINIFSFFVAEQLYPYISHLDPDNVYLVLTIHHICQALIALAIIGIWILFSHTRWTNFGFNLNQFSYSLKMTVIFSAIWFAIQLILGVLLVAFAGFPVGFTFPFNTRNFWGYFLFEILLSGTSEEIIFRSLVITILASLWQDHIIKLQVRHLVLIGVSTLIFMFDHINFGWSPFRIVYFNVLQLGTCLIFGIFYGYLFLKTKSVVGPMLTHNLLNGVITISVLLLFLWFS